MNLLTRSMIVAVVASSQLAVAQSVTVNSVNSAVEVKPAVEQPTTVVEASPLEESRAERLRKQRQEAEVDTEQKIVEKLEQSRLEDEKRRAERLFGNKIENQKAEAEQTLTAPVSTTQQMPPQMVVVPVEAEKLSSQDLESVKREIIDSIKAETAVTAPLPTVEETKPKARYFMSGSIGTSSYDSASNIEGRGAAGFMVGTEMENNFMVEGGLVYSNYFMDDFYWVTGTPIFRELDQYNVGMAVKYSPLSGRFRPMVGATVNYTYRKYFDRMIYTWSGGYIPPENEATSTAFDLGLLAGLELGISDGFALGVEYRYATNLMYRSDSDILNRRFRPNNAQLVEETDYSTLLINGKVRF